MLLVGNNSRKIERSVLEISEFGTSCDYILSLLDKISQFEALRCSKLFDFSLSVGINWTSMIIAVPCKFLG